MIELNEEFQALSQAFKHRFGYPIPLSLIPETEDNRGLREAVEACFEQGRDLLRERYAIEDGKLY